MRLDRRQIGLTCAALMIGALAAPGARATSPTRITVAAAISLRDAMPELVEAFGRRSGSPAIRVTYGASGNLRQQVEAGAPVDVVVFASPEHVDLLIERGRVVATTRCIVATNSLVLVGPPGAVPITFATIESVPDSELIAIGDPEFVPAGRYARTALQALGKWDSLQGRLVFAGHVAAVLQYARRGEVAAAIVYGTDARDAADIVVLDRAAGAWAPRIETVAAVVAGGNETGGRSFLDFLRSDAGSRILAKHGFDAARPKTVETQP